MFQFLPATILLLYFKIL